MKTCPSCQGPMVVVEKRAWCVNPYRSGGCAGFWVLGKLGWSRQAWHQPLLVKS